MAEITETNPRGAGRKPKPENAKEIWDKEIIQLVKLSRRTREFAEEQLDALREEAKISAGGLKQRLEIARTAVQLVDSLNKTSKLMMEQVDKDPKQEEESFDLASLFRSQA